MQREGSLHRLEPVVLDPQLLIAGPLPEKLLQRDVQRPERDPPLAVVEEVRVGEGDGELVVLVPDRRTQEKRSAPLQLQQQAGEVAGIFVVQSFLAEPAGLDVAVVVEHGKRVPMLEHPGALVRQAGSGQDVVRTAVPEGLRCSLSGP